MSHVPAPHALSTAVRLTAGWARSRAEAWAVASQQRSRRNAMVAATTLSRRRVEAEETALFVAGREGSRTLPQPAAGATDTGVAAGRPPA